MKNENNDRLLALLSKIDDLATELEELEECGTLEERLECSLRIEELRREHFRASMEETGGL